MINEVLDIYSQLKQSDKKLSKRRFSREYLGLCESYLNSKEYYGKDINIKGVIKLRNQLKGIADVYGQLYDADKREHYQRKYHFFNGLANKATDIIFHSAS